VSRLAQAGAYLRAFRVAGTANAAKHRQSVGPIRLLKRKPRGPATAKEFRQMPEID